MNILLLSGFNNYFNRRIIKYSSIDDYLDTDHSEALLDLEKINFNPNDNVGTKIILNTTLDNADYLVVYDDDDNIISRWFVLSNVRQRNGQYEHSLKRDVIADNLDTLMTSPIYVHKGMLSEDNPLILNSEGMSFNQIKTDETLLKDISNVAWLVGYISKNCPAEEITTSAQDTILEFTTLNDIASAMGTTESILSSLINIGETTNTPAYFTNKLIFAYSYLGGGETTGVQNTYWVKQIFNGEVLDRIEYSNTYTISLDDKEKALYTSNFYSPDYFKQGVIANSSALKTSMLSYTGRNYYIYASQLETLKSFAGQIILYNGIYYLLNIAEKNNRTYTHINKQLPSGYATLDTIVNYGTNVPLNNGRITLRTEDIECYIQLVEIDASQNTSLLKTKITSSRTTCKNQVYDMFAIPYGEVKIYIDDDDYYYSGISSEQALKLAIEIARELDAQLYDLQLLPYCPYLKNTYYDEVEKAICLSSTNILDQNYSYIYQTHPTNAVSHNVSITGTEAWVIEDITHPHLGEIKRATYIYTPTVSAGYNLSTSSMTLNSTAIENGWNTMSPQVLGSQVRIIAWNSDQTTNTRPQGTLTWVETPVADTVVKSIIYWCNSATFETQLNYSLSIEESRKLDSQCNMYRLVSPNYQGSFEFNVAKNGTSIDYFTAYCTYKPYTPFIKVEPQFSGLYGTNFNDNRGLICGGDFSIPRFTDRWETYELNNKNYQNIFNREIANLDFNNQIAMRNQIINATTGVVGDTVKGAGTGAMLGGGWGAIAGAVVGLGTSTIGAVYDTTTLQREQHENRQLAIDKFNFSLGNIKALPYTLTKVGAFDISSKLFPFVEYYTCTDEEKQMLRDKITYESMTVFKIDYFGNYVSQDTTKHYFKGELIRNLDLYVATNVFNEIYNELLKGVYI